MVQLTILSGDSAGTMTVARRFPFWIGRDSGSHLRLDAPGVWDRHLELAWDATGGVVGQALGGGLVAVAGAAFQRRALRNGDVLELGAIKIRFSLSATNQRDFRLREWLTWLALGGLMAGQGLLIWWLREAL
ncbi:MAG: FHA domain-containing protein [Verrucomicrobia bacterium]|nr:FHA domain-containing protein [Verrucomicrobiota bacterium]